MVMATRNQGKVADLRHLLADAGLDVELYAVSDLPQQVPEVDETGVTFEENAVLKARQVSLTTGMPALGDDSGLEVDALDGAPGVYSARYAGMGAGDAANNTKLLTALAAVPEALRVARFRSVVAFCDPLGPLGEGVLTGEGSCSGTVLTVPRGTGGFGYDPLFLSDELGLTFAEATIEQKGKVSHRSRALAALIPKLCEYFQVAKKPPGG
jgi:XTP/dITP diphosphohydrolase